MRKWILLFLFIAGACPCLVAAEENKKGELPSPVLVDMKMPALPGQAAEAEDPFKLAAEEYVRRDYKAALAHLKEALRQKKDNDRAKQLLLKVYVRMMREKYEGKQYKDAWAVLQESRKYFPAHPDIELMARSIAQQIPEVMASEKPKKEPDASPDTKMRRPPASAPAAPVEPPKSAAAPAPAEKPIMVTVKTPAPVKQPWGSSPNDWMMAAILLSAVGALIYLIRQSQAALSQQSRLFQEVLSREREQRDEMMKKMDMQLELIKKLQEALESQNHGARDGKTEEPQAPRRNGGSPPSPRASHMDRILASRQKKQIMDVLVNLSPPEREMKEENIATQAQNLYDISPSEAVKFLGGLAQDDSPLIRAIITPALAKISTDETLGFLLELRQDKDADVQRSAYKQLKKLSQADPASLLPGHYQRITEALREEVNKGEWIL